MKEKPLEVSHVTTPTQETGYSTDSNDYSMETNKHSPQIVAVSFGIGAKNHNLWGGTYLYGLYLSLIHI